ncbi:hypothetical protein TRICI_000663 [Trichomonascus ciferrii]|jgi:nuclear transcription Y subunit beta|uniref:Transcription factor CBF/NF-Y/archaeal histone domain-containing protein n=1 Tax=Trichomonascus ciferrii TaxID=44093 RepID=A0A642VBH9_9ASCO|nr:hypothetical protein TRICI_000663 [Trichomonascus ciferrii]
MSDQDSDHTNQFVGEPNQGPNAQGMSELDLLLPLANVARLMKNAIPENAKVSKEAKECMQECVTEFVAFVTSESAEICLGEKRKTINGQDVLHALTSLGMENYAEVLKIYLAKYRMFVNAKERDEHGEEMPDDSELRED